MSSTPSNDWADKVEDLREQASASGRTVRDQAGSAADDLTARASSAAADLSARAGAAASDLSDRAAAHAADFRDAAGEHADNLKTSAQASTQTLRDAASAIAADLKTQASAQMDDAKGVITSMADEARSRISGIIDQQKSLGADKLTGISRAAHNAADDLDAQNPHVAKLVRDAAGSVDMIAGNLRSSSLGDVVASVSSFARKQPVAFFAGSVLAGFALARFIKSEPSHPQPTSSDTQG